jgi:hypothetical protein
VNAEAGALVGLDGVEVTTSSKKTIQALRQVSEPC